MRKMATIAGIGAIGLLVAGMAAWVSLAIYYSGPPGGYLYRTRITPESARRLFMEYLNQINEMKTKPEFYNTLTTNCTTNVVRHIRAFGGKVAYKLEDLPLGVRSPICL